MQSKAQTVEQYLNELPEDRREAILQVREVVLKHLPKGLEEGIGCGMISYFVPHSVYPPGYHCDPKSPLLYAALASQKSHMALYLMTLYASPALQERVTAHYKARGRKPDMGKSCWRFRKLSDLPLDLVAELVGAMSVEEYIQRCEAAVAASKTGRKKAAGK